MQLNECRLVHRRLVKLNKKICLKSRLKSVGKEQIKTILPPTVAAMNLILGNGIGIEKDEDKQSI